MTERNRKQDGMEMGEKKEMRDWVVQELNSYPEKIRQVRILRYELEHMPTVSPNEVLEAMSYAHGDEKNHSAGHISDKTLYIALNYQSRAENLNDERSGELAAHLVKLEQALDRLEHFVVMLDERQQMVLRRHCFEQQPWDTIAKEVSLTPKTLRRILETAVNKLTEMYEFAAQSHGDKHLPNF